MEPSRTRVELVAVDGPPRPRVRLRRGTQEVSADIYPTAAHLMEGVAEATLDAIVDLLPPVVSMELEQVHVVAAERPVVVLVITVSVAGVAIAHTGSALIGDRPEVAAAKAALAAVNRRLEILEPR